MMLRFVLCLLLTIVGSAAQAQVGGTDVPAALPGDIKEWDEYPSCHRLPPCELKLANAAVEYNLYVDPKINGVYSVSHYRVRPTARIGLFDRAAYHGSEVVVWFDQFKARKPARVFIKRDDRWVEVPHGSPEATLEMAVANRLWRIRADTLEDPEIEKTLAATRF